MPIPCLFLVVKWTQKLKISLCEIFAKRLRGNTSNSVNEKAQPRLKSIVHFFVTPVQILYSYSLVSFTEKVWYTDTQE